MAFLRIRTVYWTNAAAPRWRSEECVISFNCPRCEKGFLLPNRHAGELTWCSACGEEIVVPKPRARRRRRSWLVPGLLLLVVGMVAVTVGLATRQADREALVRARLEGRLHDFSPRWQGIAWQKCDPEQGLYELSAFYEGERGVYTFEVKHMAALSQTFVVVDPRADAPAWLAQARFQGGLAMEYDYVGREGNEKDTLARLTKQIAQALHEAID
jgi:hypothetical protein